jgi:hypothetical protein
MHCCSVGFCPLARDRLTNCAEVDVEIRNDRFRRVGAGDIGRHRGRPLVVAWFDKRLQRL